MKNLAIMLGVLLYVSNIAGSDGNTGSKNCPLRTVAHAMNLAKAGDTVVLLDHMTLDLPPTPDEPPSCQSIS